MGRQDCILTDNARREYLIMSDMKEKFAQLDLVISELKDQPGALMPVLQKAQSISSLPVITL